ncbi:MAG TPA: isoprenylcysteine carboxylmethyltransferase family protein [Bacteroidia bacterium]|jgi:methyltransferase|nr:isoprenylcysteine carboxylmethyltransferase family protein [Bacteroidia bacterium]
MTFIAFISFVILLRLGELMISARNEKWLLNNGAVESGKSHYPFMVALHVLFFISLIAEFFSHTTVTFSLFFLVFYFLLLAFKTWTILSLGKFWNTKIYRIPGTPLVNRGPYKFLKHPNYLIVISEVAVIPLAFHLYFTAVIFTVLNAVMLWVRIREENKVLQEKISEATPIRPGLKIFSTYTPKCRTNGIKQART